MWVSWCYLYQMHHFVLLKVQIYAFPQEISEVSSKAWNPAISYEQLKEELCFFGSLGQLECHPRLCKTKPHGPSVLQPEGTAGSLPTLLVAAQAEGLALTSRRLAGSRPYCWLRSSSCTPSKLQSVPSKGSEISVLRKDKGKHCHAWVLHRSIGKAGLRSLPTWGLCLNHS